MGTQERFTIDCDVRPEFTACYLRTAGDQCAFIETHTSRAVPRLLAALTDRGRRPEDVRWIVVTHAHLDHAAGAGVLLARCPNATVLAHPRAARHLVDPSKLVASATSVYGVDRFAELYGKIEPIPQARMRALDDGETFDLGGAELRVRHTAGHAKHHMIIDDPATSSVYTGDSFGLVYPALQRGARFAIASTSPTDFDAAEARKSIDTIVGLGERQACLTHFGPIADIVEVASQLRGWIDRSEEWLEAAAKSDDDLPAMTAALERKIRDAMIDDAAGRGLSLDERDLDLLSLDIELNAQGLAFVAARRRAAPAH